MNGGFVSYFFLFGKFISLLKITIFRLRREDPKIFIIPFLVEGVCFGWGNCFFLMLLFCFWLNFF
jgi:hypothetical protein